MFEETGYRIGSILLRSFDLAVEFATLGEYGLGGPRSELGGEGAAVMARPERCLIDHHPSSHPAPLAVRVGPATAAGRSRARELAADPPQAILLDDSAPVRCGGRTAVVRRVPRPARVRAGAAAPPPQLCLSPLGERSGEGAE